MRNVKNEQGLTLVETLVALAILGAVAAAVLALISQNTRFTAAAEDRFLAGVLVDNLMIEDLARLSPLERGERERDAEFAGRRWKVRTNIVDTGAGLNRIEIKILDSAGRQVQANAVTLKAEKQ